jgi:multiple sugar transport system permease protein
MIIPWAMPTVVACTVFLVSLDPSYGFFNWFLTKIGAIEKGFSFFSQPNSALLCIIVIGIWKYFPFATLMLLAELQSIPPELYDSAAIDGAGAFRKFAHITWPLLQPVWRVILILQTLWAIKEFELVFLITGGGPDNGTAIIGVDVYRNAFRFYKVGSASAEGIFLLIFSIIFAYFYFRSMREKRAGTTR